MNSFIVEYLYLIIFDYFSDGGTIHGHRRDDVKNLVKDGNSLDHWTASGVINHALQGRMQVTGVDPRQTDQSIHYTSHNEFMLVEPSEIRIHNRTDSQLFFVQCT